MATTPPLDRALSKKDAETVQSILSASGEVPLFCEWGLQDGQERIITITNKCRLHFIKLASFFSWPKASIEHLLEVSGMSFVDPSTVTVKLRETEFTNVSCTQISHFIKVIRELTSEWIEYPSELRLKLDLPEYLLLPISTPALDLDNGFISLFKSCCSFYNAAAARDVVVDKIRELHFTAGDQNRRFIFRDAYAAVTDISAADVKAVARALRYNTFFDAFVLFCVPAGDEGIVAVADMLRTNHTIQDLTLSATEATKVGMIALSDAIVSNPSLSLVSADLCYNNIGKEGIQALTRAFENMSTGLECLKLDQCGLDSRASSSLFQTLKAPQWTGTLQHLDMSHNALGKEGSQSLAAFLTASTALRNLLLVESYVDSDVICSSIVKNNGLCASLRLLDLSENRLGKKTGSLLVDLINKKKGPLFYNLNSCSVSRKFAEQLLVAASKGRGMKLSLDLSNNDLGIQFAKRLVEILPPMRNLETLILNDNNMGDEGLGLLFQSLIGKFGPKKLSLDRNVKAGLLSTHTRAGLALAQLMGSNSSRLEVLAVSGDSDNWYLKSGLHTAIHGLMMNKTLTAFDISGNRLGDEGAKILGMALPTNTSLKSLFWDYNRTTIRGYAMFWDGLKENSSLSHMPLPVADIQLAFASSNQKQKMELTELLQNIEAHIEKNLNAEPVVKITAESILAELDNEESLVEEVKVRRESSRRQETYSVVESGRMSNQEGSSADDSSAASTPQSSTSQSITPPPELISESATRPKSSNPIDNILNPNLNRVSNLFGFNDSLNQPSVINSRSVKFETLAPHLAGSPADQAESTTPSVQVAPEEDAEFKRFTAELNSRILKSTVPTAESIPESPTSTPVITQTRARPVSIGSRIESSGVPVRSHVNQAVDSHFSLDRNRLISFGGAAPEATGSSIRARTSTVGSRYEVTSLKRPSLALNRSRASSATNRTSVSSVTSAVTAVESLGDVLTTVSEVNRFRGSVADRVTDEPGPISIQPESQRSSLSRSFYSARTSYITSGSSGSWVSGVPESIETLNQVFSSMKRLSEDSGSKPGSQSVVAVSDVRLGKSVDSSLAAVSGLHDPIKDLRNILGHIERTVEDVQNSRSLGGRAESVFRSFKPPPPPTTSVDSSIQAADHLVGSLALATEAVELRSEPVHPVLVVPRRISGSKTDSDRKSSLEAVTSNKRHNSNTSSTSFVKTAVTDANGLRPLPPPIPSPVTAPVGQSTVSNVPEKEKVESSLVESDVNPISIEPEKRVSIDFRRRRLSKEQLQIEKPLTGIAPVRAPPPPIPIQTDSGLDSAALPSVAASAESIQESNRSEPSGAGQPLSAGTKPLDALSLLAALDKELAKQQQDNDRRESASEQPIDSPEDTMDLDNDGGNARPHSEPLKYEKRYSAALIRGPKTRLSMGSHTPLNLAAIIAKEALNKTQTQNQIKVLNDNETVEPVETVASVVADPTVNKLAEREDLIQRQVEAESKPKTESIQPPVQAPFASAVKKFGYLPMGTAVPLKPVRSEITVPTKTVSASAPNVPLRALKPVVVESSSEPTKDVIKPSPVATTVTTGQGPVKAVKPFGEKIPPVAQRFSPVFPPNFGTRSSVQPTVTRSSPDIETAAVNSTVKETDKVQRPSQVEVEPASEPKLSLKEKAALLGNKVMLGAPGGPKTSLNLGLGGGGFIKPLIPTSSSATVPAAVRSSTSTVDPSSSSSAAAAAETTNANNVNSVNSVNSVNNAEVNVNVNSVKNAFAAAQANLSKINLGLALGGRPRVSGESRDPTGSSELGGASGVGSGVHQKLDHVALSRPMLNRNKSCAVAGCNGKRVKQNYCAKHVAEIRDTSSSSSSLSSSSSSIPTTTTTTATTTTTTTTTAIPMSRPLPAVASGQVVMAKSVAAAVGGRRPQTKPKFEFKEPEEFGF